MARSFTQTDTSSTVVDGSNFGCSGVSTNGASHIFKDTVNGGTAGTSDYTVGAAGSASNVVCVRNEISPGTGISWDSGNWTWRLNVTSSNMNLTLEAVYICRLNSSGTNQATIGSATGLGVSLSTTGVKSGTISGSAQTPNTGDIVGIYFLFSNGAMTTQNCQIRASENIDSPFTTQTRAPRPTSVGHPFIC